MEYRLQRTVESAEGWQEFTVEANSLEEAYEKFKDGQGCFQEEELEVMALSPVSLDEIISPTGQIEGDNQ